jgi:hypothetical protein
MVRQELRLLSNGYPTRNNNKFQAGNAAGWAKLGNRYVVHSVVYRFSYVGARHYSIYNRQ